MALLFLPDNTVLVNFAHINRVLLLEDIAHERAWCATVAEECARSADFPGLAALDQAPAVFGEPLRPDSAELLDTRILRDRMAEPGDGPHKHLGEAEIISIISRREFNAIFATDDAGATAYARAEDIVVVTTWQLLQVAFRRGLLHEDEVWNDARTLRSLNRGWPPCGHEHEAFRAWLGP